MRKHYKPLVLLTAVVLLGIVLMWARTAPDADTSVVSSAAQDEVTAVATTPPDTFAAVPGGNPPGIQGLANAGPKLNSVSDILELNDQGNPEQVFERSDLLRRARLICSAFHSTSGSGSRSFVEHVHLINRGAEISPEHLKSAELVDAFRARFCSGGTDLEPVGAELLMEQFERLKDLGLEAILTALDFPEDAEQSVVVDTRSSLVEIMSTTSSPSVFQLAAEPFSQPNALGQSFPEEGFDPGYVDPINPMGYRFVGVMLAYCALSPSTCGPEGLTTFQLCMPSNCRRGESVFAFFQRTESPQVMLAAQRYAQVLLQVRRRR